MSNKIAAIIGNGKYLKKSLKNNAAIKKVKIQVKSCAILLVAPDFIFRAVLIKTAVTGIQPKSHVHIFENDNHKISLSLLNFTLVIFSAILAEIIVSSTAITAITTDVEKTSFNSKIISFKESIFK
jgi:hypothetical protein